MKRLDPMDKGIKFLERLCEKKRLRDPSVYMKHKTAFPKPEPTLLAVEVPAR